MAALREHEIDEIEQALDLRLPSDVREQYLISNGLLGPTNCQLLYTWREDPETDILRHNAIRSEDWFPEAMRSIVLLGDDGCGNSICYDWAAQEAILWNPADGEDVQERRSTVKELWCYIEDLYANDL